MVPLGTLAVRSMYASSSLEVCLRFAQSRYPKSTLKVRTYIRICNYNTFEVRIIKLNYVHSECP